MTDEKKPGTSTLHLSAGTLRSRPDAGGGFSRGGGILSRGVPSPAVTVQIKRKRPTIGIPQEKHDLAPKVEENLPTETLSPARKPVSVPPAKTGSTLSEEERRTRQQALSQSPVFEAPADTDLRTLRVVKHTREEEIPASSETTVPVEAAPEAPEVKKEMVPAAARPKPGCRAPPGKSGINQR
jgi:hypothetical protein